jgi:hypothetical protein
MSFLDQLISFLNPQETEEIPLATLTTCSICKKKGYYNGFIFAYYYPELGHGEKELFLCEKCKERD